MLRQTFGLAVLGLMLAGCNSSNDENGSDVAPPPSADTTTAPRANQTVHLMAFNDFHGNLEPPKRFVTVPDPQNPGKTVNIPAGGISYLADAVAKLRARYGANSALLSGGDLVGASPLISSLFADEPTIEAMNLLKLDANVVGNHEFDRGTAELRRLANGGCQQTSPNLQPCQVNANYAGAKFDFLAANVIEKSSGKPLFRPYKIMRFGGIPVALVGVVTRTTPSIVAAAGIQDVTFQDEADTVNALVPELKAQGVQAIVIMLHEGANSSTRPLNSTTCEGLTGNAIDIANRLDPAVDVIVTGHTHQTYSCDYSQVNPAKPFLITSASAYGVLLTDIALELDGKTGDVTRKSAQQVVIQSEPYTAGSTSYPLTSLYEAFAKTPAIETLLSPYREKAVAISGRIVGSVIGPITRNSVASGENSLGNLIADAQLANTRVNGAQFALMNPGGVRADLVPTADGQVTYGQLFAVQPFGNGLVTMTLSGTQLKQLLEQQWSGSNANSPRILLPSAGLTYRYHTTGDSRAYDIKVNGQPISDATTYRFTVNSFLADGGDNFTVLKQGTDRVGGALDVDALEDYFRTSSPVSPAPTNRITKD